MKRPIVLLLIAVLLVAGYVAYDRWLAAPNPDAWDFIPAHAALVWENDAALVGYDSTRQLGIWSSVSEMPGLARLEGYLSGLDTLAEDVPLRKAFSGARLMIAIFPTSAAEMDALLVVHIGDAAARSFLRSAVRSFEQAGHSSRSREYNGVTIQELAPEGKPHTFSYFLMGDYLVGSFTPFLVEDAVRTWGDPALGFRANFSRLSGITPLLQDEGNVYVNARAFSNVLQLFSEDDIIMPGESSFLDVDVRDASVKLSGFTFPAQGLLSTFSSGPGSFNLLEVVPNNTATLRHFSFEDSETWRSGLLRYAPEAAEATRQMRASFDTDVDFLFTQIGQEIAVAELEVVGTEAPDRIIVFDVEDAQATSDWLRQAATRMSPDSLFTDREGDYEIVRMDQPLIGQALLGKTAAFTTECYYLLHREYVIMSNSLGELKRLVQALAQDNTWQKSLRVNNMLELANKEANYTVMVNVPRAWNRLMQVVKPEWKEVLQANERGFKSLEYIGAQFSKVDNKFYTSLMAYQPETPRQPTQVAQAEKSTLPARIISKPFVVRTHANPTLEVIVQDSTNQVYHLTNELDILWAVHVGSPIIGSVQSVDYYLNGKIQYAFSTANHLHIIDRTGTYVEGFPKKYPSKSAAQYFSVVDYDGSRNYRFMVTDADGDVWLMDKTGKALNGWAPMAGGRSLIATPRHIRVAGKDAFILMKKREIDLVNRAGKSYPGFPLNLQTDLTSGYFPRATGSFETSTLTALSDQGEIIRVNFGGKVEFREQLVKTAAETRFQLVPDALENTFLIVRSGDTTWEVLDAGGVRLFEKGYVKPTVNVQFYRFGGDKALLLLADTAEGFLTVLDLGGQPVTSRPMPVGNPASVIYFENQDLYQFYLTHGRTVEKIRIN